MTKPRRSENEVHRELAAIYTEIMWLASRPNVTPAMARGWYSHLRAGSLMRDIRQFSGKVSKEAIDDTDAKLILEHHARMQKRLSDLIRDHLGRNRRDKDEFIHVLLACESVHVVTFDENVAARKADGNYRRAGIELVPWRRIDKARRKTIWREKLRGRVVNAAEFAPAP